MRISARNQIKGKIIGVTKGATTAHVRVEIAWVDGIQNDAYLKPTGSSGVRECEGVRKSLKFEFGTSPVILQVSGVPKDEIRIAVMPASTPH